MKKNPPVLIAGMALASAVLTAPVLQAGQNPFVHTEWQAGYNYNQEPNHAEGKCGEGKCGEGMDEAPAAGGAGADKGKQCPEGKCGEGKCGEGVCGSDKCGEGKCASDKPHEG